MLEELKQRVYEANRDLPRRGLVTDTWGNVSGIDRKQGLVVIKPSGVAYASMRPEDMVVIALETGERVEGALAPSSDTPTHLELYRAFPALGGIVHTHSTYAVAWAQVRQDIPCYGTTHADYFYGTVPCTRELAQEEIDAGYEAYTGRIIVETFQERQIDPTNVPAVLCANHGPFAWGENPAQAVCHAAVLEAVAQMALLTRLLDRDVQPAPQRLQDKHYLRKHGPDAYYGQQEI